MSEPDVAEKVRMALAKAGYPVEVSADSTNDRFLWIRPDVPNEAYWRAIAVSGVARTCWPCFSVDPEGNDPPECTHDPLTSEWPPVPPRP